MLGPTRDKVSLPPDTPEGKREALRIYGTGLLVGWDHRRTGAVQELITAAKLADARVLAKKEMERLLRTGDNRRLGWALQDVALLTAAVNGISEEVLALAKQSHELLDAANGKLQRDSSDSIRAFNAYSFILETLDSFDEAHTVAIEVKEKALERGHKTEAAIALQLEAKYFERRDRDDEAVVAWQACVDLSKHVRCRAACDVKGDCIHAPKGKKRFLLAHDRLNLAKGHDALSIVHETTQEYTKAIHSARIAYKAWLALDRNEEAAKSMHRIAFCRLAQGKYKASLTTAKVAAGLYLKDYRANDSTFTSRPPSSVSIAVGRCVAIEAIAQFRLGHGYEKAMRLAETALTYLRALTPTSDSVRRCMLVSEADRRRVLAMRGDVVVVPTPIFDALMLSQDWTLEKEMEERKGSKT